MSRIAVATPEDMHNLAAQIARACKLVDCLTLTGELGAGKTEFTRGFIAALSREPVEVTSPTFTLVQPYDVEIDKKPTRLWHFDLYRLKHPEELLEIGFDDAVQTGITLIEWPEIAQDRLPFTRLGIDIVFGDNEARSVSLTPHGDWQTKLSGIG